MQPSVIYRRDPSFYFRYDMAWLVGISLTIVALAWAWFGGYRGLLDGYSNWIWLGLPLAIYLHVAANAVVHNCCHVNLPKSINRPVGEILGALVMTRFASWEILHVRHHRYSDDIEKDPHFMDPSFWVFLVNTMVINVERQLQNIRYDQFGDTPENRRVEKVRAILSFVTMAALAVMYFLVLGPWLTAVFAIAQIVGWLVVSHFNWATHNGKKGSDFKPINLDDGWYWFGNRIWFGLYMHANHHRRANVFNPLKMDQVMAKRAAARNAP